MLTAAQANVMREIRRHMRKHGGAPTLAELCERTGTRSVGSMSKHVTALVKAGLIVRGEGGWRQIAIKDRCPCCGQALSAQANGVAA